MCFAMICLMLCFCGCSVTVLSSEYQGGLQSIRQFGKDAGEISERFEKENAEEKFVSSLLEKFSLMPYVCDTLLTASDYQDYVSEKQGYGENDVYFFEENGNIFAFYRRPDKMELEGNYQSFNVFISVQLLEGENELYVRCGYDHVLRLEILYRSGLIVILDHESGEKYELNYSKGYDSLKLIKTGLCEL